MTKHTWQALYAAGEQLNRYPYDFIVSAFFRHRPVPADGRPLKVLDLGCGAGNHALFFAENGCEVCALDYSRAALEVLDKRAAERGLQQRVRTGHVDFEDFDVDEDGFDIVVDRLAVSHVSGRHARGIYAEMHRRMRDGGILLANLFTTEHSHAACGHYDEEQDVWRDFSDGIFQHLDSAYFYDERGVRDLLRHYELLSLVRENADDLVQQDRKSIWKIVARKS